MLFSRLLLARSLLSPDGVILISIDDHESANLKKICDEVFGESNYLNQFAWVSNIAGRQISGRGAAKTWESVLAYARDIDACGSLSIDIRFAREKMPDAYKGFRRDVRTDRLGHLCGRRSPLQS
ncbi:DNA methyltransferase [Oscillibacter sp.]|uniref:DNA methyltransferase n=1 Tax=Oscillibacter sp. TaxID=1945593 RepID=UPI00257E62E1|nr:DNA methyltransferase [Oscillibacter sp.]